MKGCIVCFLSIILLSAAIPQESFADGRSVAQKFKAYLTARQNYLNLKTTFAKNEMDIVGFCSGPTGVGSPAKCQKVQSRRDSIIAKLKALDSRQWPGDFNLDGAVDTTDQQLLGLCLDNPLSPPIDCHLMDLDQNGTYSMGDAVLFTKIKGIYDICNFDRCDIGGGN